MSKDAWYNLFRLSERLFWKDLLRPDRILGLSFFYNLHELQWRI